MSFSNFPPFATISWFLHICKFWWSGYKSFQTPEDEADFWHGRVKTHLNRYELLKFPAICKNQCSAVQSVCISSYWYLILLPVREALKSSEINDIDNIRTNPTPKGNFVIRNCEKKIKQNLPPSHPQEIETLFCKFFFKKKLWISKIGKLLKITMQMC